MRKIITIIVLITLILCVGCSEDMNFKVDSASEDTLYVKIDNFPDILKRMDGSYSGLSNGSKDFTIDEINEEVFDFLKSSDSPERNCIVSVSYNYTDKYGAKRKTDFQRFFPLDLSDLKQYKNYKLWVNSTGGVISLKYGNPETELPEEENKFNLVH